MTDDQALIAAVCDRPDDDTPRLVYADWCDDNDGMAECGWCRGTGEDRKPGPFPTGTGITYEYVGPLGPCPRCKGARGVPNGLAARAAFVRAQVKLARLPNFRENRQLMGRALAGDPELMAALGEYTTAAKEEGGAFAAMPGDQKCLRGGEGIGAWVVPFNDPHQWSRGFPEVCRFHSTFWRDRHAELRAAAPIRRVELPDVPEVEFGPTRETVTSRVRDRLIDIRTDWEATWGGHRERFGQMTTIMPEIELAYTGGEFWADRRVEQHRAEVAEARTPLDYLRLRWPKVEFVLPRLLGVRQTPISYYAPGYEEWAAQPHVRAENERRLRDGREGAEAARRLAAAVDRLPRPPAD